MRRLPHLLAATGSWPAATAHAVCHPSHALGDVAAGRATAKALPQAARDQHSRGYPLQRKACEGTTTPPRPIAQRSGLVPADQQVQSCTGDRPDRPRGADVCSPGPCQPEWPVRREMPGLRRRSRSPRRRCRNRCLGGKHGAALRSSSERGMDRPSGVFAGDDTNSEHGDGKLAKEETAHRRRSLRCVIHLGCCWLRDCRRRAEPRAGNPDLPILRSEHIVRVLMNLSGS
jgi:hypothetical protein